MSGSTSNVIDELVVTVRLDKTKFEQGDAEARSAFRRTQEEARKQFGLVEEAGNQTAAAFNKLRNEALALFGLFIGTTSISQFVKDTTNASAAAGRMATNIGISTKDLTEWQEVSKRFGGSAEATGRSLFGLSQEFQRFAITGRSGLIDTFRALQVPVTDANNHLRAFNDILFDLADKFSKMEPARAHAFGAMLGLDEGLINTLIQGREALRQYLADAEKLGTITQRDAEAGIAFQRSIMNLQQVLNTVGRNIVTDLVGPADQAIDRMTKWTAANRAWIEEDIVTAIKQSGTAIVGWGTEIDHVVEATAGWKRVLTDVATYAALGFLGPVGVLGRIALAVTEIQNALNAASQSVEKLIFGEQRATSAQRLREIGPFPSQEQIDWATSGRPGAMPTGDPNQPGMGGWYNRFRWDDPSTWLPHRGILGGATTSGPPAVGTPAHDVARETHDFWISQGYNEVQVAGILAGGPGGESGFDPQSVGDNGTSFGLYQHHADRLAAMRARYGANPTVRQQNEFAAWEMSPAGPYADVGRALREQTTAEGSTLVFTSGFERPANVGAVAASRARRASEYVNRYGGTPAPSARPRTAPEPPAPSVAPVPGATPDDPHGFGRYLRPDAAPLPPPLPTPLASLGGAQLAAMSQAPAYNTTSQSSAVNINGPINIQTQAKDADGVGRSMGEALRRYAYVPQANTGLV